MTKQWKETDSHGRDCAIRVNPASECTCGKLDYLADNPDNGQVSLESFISKHNLKFECHRVDARPDGLMNNDPQYLESAPKSTMRHFRCRITRPHYVKDNFPMKTMSMGLYFSQGSAHTQDPTLSDVLDCLASDASGYENARSFEDWAGEYGYEADSREAEKTFRAIKRQANQLKRTIGESAYQELLWNTERL